MPVDLFHDLPVVRHGLRIVHMTGGHFAVVSLTVGIGAHAHADPGRAVPGQMLIEGAGQGWLHVVRGDALGAQDPVFQCHIADLQGREQMFVFQ